MMRYYIVHVYLGQQRPPEIWPDCDRQELFTVLQGVTRTPIPSVDLILIAPYDYDPTEDE